MSAQGAAQFFISMMKKLRIGVINLLIHKSISISFTWVV